MKVEVNWEPDCPDDDEDLGWNLTFEFDLESGCHFSFHVEEPEFIAEQAWRDLANGVGKRVVLYQGNGEGCISLTERDTLVFIAAPSGSGGDVRANFEVPRSVVQGPLLSALDDAIQLGFRSRC